MNHLTDIQYANACLRQFHSSPEGFCSADDIALAEGIPLERCRDILARLEEAHLVETLRMADNVRYRLVDTVTALEVLHAIWAPKPPTVFIPLYASMAQAEDVTRTCSQGQWAQG